MKKLHYQAIAITRCSLCLRCCLRHVFSASAAIPAVTRSRHPHPHRQHPPRQRSRRQHPYPNLCANSQALIHPCFPCCIRSDKAAHLPAKVITKAKNNVHNRRYCFDSVIKSVTIDGNWSVSTKSSGRHLCRIQRRRKRVDPFRFRFESKETFRC